MRVTLSKLFLILGFSLSLLWTYQATPFWPVLLLLLSCFSRVWLCATPQTAAHQARPSLGFSRQEQWSGLPFPSPMRESEKWRWSHSVVSDSSRPHGLQPTRLLRPWDFPGKSAGVECHCLLCCLLYWLLKTVYQTLTRTMNLYICLQLCLLFSLNIFY